MTDCDDFTNDPTVKREMAIRAIYAAAEQLYDVMPAAFAHQFVNDARDDADKKYRQKRQSQS